MIRDYERITRQLESVIRVLNDYADKSQTISIHKACEIAGVHQAWLYRILNNIDTYQISEELIERLEDARDRVISVIIQRLDDIAHCEGGDDSDNSSGNNTDEETSSSRNKDSGNRIARDSLRLKHEQWKLKNLLPKHFNEGTAANALVVNGNVNQQYNIQLGHLTPEQLRVIASIKVTDQSKDNE